MTNKWKKGFATLFAAMLLALPALTSCNGNETSGGNGGEAPAAITIRLDKTTYSAMEDETFFLIATTNSARSVRWTSDDPTVASVNSSGRVIAKKVGTVKITADAEGKTAECVVTVTASDRDKGAYLRVSRTKVYLDMKSKESKPLSAEYVSVQNGEETVLTDKAVSYTSADESIATVSESGEIAPVSVGTTDIIITSEGMTEYVTADVYSAAIGTPAEWLAMFEKTCDIESRYYLANDIDFTGVEYDIGALAGSGNIGTCFFGAEIDGDCHSVKNITMSGASQSLFGTTVGLKLRNVSFENILFTAEAERAAGIAHTFGQHTSRFGEDTVLESDISNVALDLAFETPMGTGISWTNYGMNMRDVFIRMRKGENSAVSEFPDHQTATGYVDHETLPSEITTKAFMGVSRMAYNWGYGKSGMSDVVVYCEIENAGGVIGMGYGTFEGVNVAYSEKQMRASYDAYRIFDHNVWDVHPERLPKLIKNS